VSAVADRPQTWGEELANSLSHGFGLLAAVASMPILLYTSALHGTASSIIGASVFSATMVLLYFASALYHALPHGRAKRILVRVDHGAIYLFIAGSYTPFTLGVLYGAWGWTLLGLVWGIAVTGVLLKAFDRLRHPWWSTGLYLTMGWLAVIAAVPLAERMAATGLALLIAGGLCYTAGVAFFATDSKLKFGHFVWHLFVVAGSVCHFFAVLWYAG
jgi:hemolysin III